MSSLVGPDSASPRPPARAVRARSSTRRAAALRAANQSAGSWGWVWRWATAFQLAAVGVLLVRALIIEAYKIPSTSMQGTLLAGDFLLVNKASFGVSVPFTGWRMPAWRTAQVGDVVVFAWPQDPRVSFVKRVAGVAGDTVAMVRGVLHRNGRTVAEPYVRSAPVPAGEDALTPPWSGAEVFGWQRAHLSAPQPFYFPSRDDWGPLVVPPGHLFVLGDNRANSLDSRYWGFVPDSLLRGTPLAIYYSYRPDSASAAPWVTRVRWSRIGRTVE